LFACFVAVLITWMRFASDTRELRRCTLTTLETHIVMSSLIFRLTLLLVLCLTLLLVLFSHGPNHLSYGFGSQENHFVPRRFGYGSRPHRGDQFPRRLSFPARGSRIHFEPKHLDGTRFPHRGARPTVPNGEVQRIMKISSSRMVKCWIPKIYLTNPTTEPLTSSHRM
jgi:hypothetical protein